MIILPFTQTFPKGVGLPQVYGSNVDYVLPAPERNQQGLVKVDGEYMSEDQLNRPLRESWWQERHYDFSHFGAPD